MGLNIDISSRLIEEIISKALQNLTEAYDKDETFIEMEKAIVDDIGKADGSDRRGNSWRDDEWRDVDRRGY